MSLRRFDRYSNSSFSMIITSSLPVEVDDVQQDAADGFFVDLVPWRLPRYFFFGGIL